ncbi:unnamed protein product [Cuscuta europaea]|uniref:Late embryogenesis abundant protein LEA-2 subgroup domain-containing protein n=1 Tax=Cuscuta europaea TaxID=41803 RepID=A0A9P0ZEH4_CUSEU|nr:unnamed protein product [Cuscuta europaea]
MSDPHGSKPGRRGGGGGCTNLASCKAAAVFLFVVVAGIGAVFYFFYRPKSPRIAVENVKLSDFSISNGTVNFTFFQYGSVTNPNRYEFTHYDSTIQLSYFDQPVGITFIPSGKIDGGQTQKMAAKLIVQSYPLPPSFSSSPQLVLETRMKLVGRVRVLKVFTHSVGSNARCWVLIQVSPGPVYFHC